MLTLHNCKLVRRSKYFTTFKRPIYSRQGNNDVADVEYKMHTLGNGQVEVERITRYSWDISITTRAADELGIAWE